MSLSKEEVEALRVKHGDIEHVRGKPKKGAMVDGKPDLTPTWEIVLRKPGRPDYVRYRSMVNDVSKRAEAHEALVRACIVYPSREEFAALLDTYPAICESKGANAATDRLCGFLSEDQEV
jgi:hypothetical protein